jgi:polygalacturonase
MLQAIFRLFWILGILLGPASAAALPADVCGLPKTIVVTEWGVVGDGVQDDTAAMRRLLSPNSHCGCQHRHLVIPVGATVLTYPLNLTSHTTLQVDGSLVAMASTQQWPIIPPVENYRDSEDTYKGGFTVNQYQAFLFAWNATAIRITGAGIVDGNGPFWWDMFHNNHDDLKLGGRPNLYQTVQCSELEIDSVTFKDSPFWTIHPMLSNNIYIHHMNILAPMYAPNVDGIDPDSSQNVLIEYNDVACGDDHIAIKAGVCGSPQSGYYNKCMDPDWTKRVSQYLTRNVTIRHNVFRTGMGIAIGSESSGGIRDVYVYNNTIGLCDSGSDTPTSCGWGPALHLKTTLTRSGTIENIIFDNNTIYNTTSFISVETNYQVGNQNLPANYPKTKVQNIVFRNNQALGGAIGASFHCDVLDPCHDIQVINNTIVEATLHKQNPWGCDFIDSYTVRDNQPEGLEECMANSMNKTVRHDGAEIKPPSGYWWKNYTGSDLYLKTLRN